MDKNEIKLEELMTNFPAINKTSELMIANYKNIVEVLDTLTIKFKDTEFKTIQTDKEYFEYKKGEKRIKTFQDKLKDFLKTLDNKEIENLRNKTNDLLKILGAKAGTTKGNIGFALNLFKNERIESFINIFFEQIQDYPEYPKDFDKFYKDCLEGIKGKSNFDEMQDTISKIADNHSFVIERTNSTFLTYKKEINIFAKEIGYIIDTDFMTEFLKKSIKEKLNIDQIKEIIKEKRKQQIIEEDIRRLRKKEKSELKSDDMSKKKEFNFNFYLTDEDFDKLICLLDTNNFKYFIIKKD